MNRTVKILAIGICLLFLVGPLTGIQAGADDGSRMPSGNTADRIVLGELFTGTWCGYCRYAEQAMDSIVDNAAYFDSRFVLIEWHIGDSYEGSDNAARKNYYNPSGYPTAKFDGVAEVVGAGSAAAAETAYRQKIDGRPQTADVFLEIDAVLKNNNTQLSVWANATLLKDTDKGSLKLHAVLVEDEDFWDGEYPIRMTARDHIFNTAVQMSKKGDTGRGSGTININPSWVIEDMMVIAFLQTDTNKEILQAGINYFTVNESPTVQGSAPSITMDEDTTDNSIDLDTFFNDPESDPITYYFAQGSDHIAASMDGNHVVTLTPDPNWSGQETITLQAADAANCPAEIEVTVTVNPVNDPPSKLGDLPNINLLEGQTKDAFNLNDYFEDVDLGDTLTYSASGMTEVDVEIKTSGLVVMSAPTGFAGSELITFEAKDPGAATVTEDCLVTVQDVNHQPKLDLDIGNIVMDEDTVYNALDLDNHFSDLDGDALAYTFSGQLFLTIEVSMENVVTITPQENWNGEEQIEVSATDGTNAPVTDTFYVTVTAVNDPPELSGGAFEEVEMDEDTIETTTATVDTLFKDLDGDNLFYNVVNPDENVEIVLNSDLTVTFEPEENWYGTVDYQITATDSQETATYEATLTVESVNDPVELVDFKPTSLNIDIKELDFVDFSIVASDADGVDPNYVWTVDGNVVSTTGTDFKLETDYDSAGTVTVKGKATDGESEVSQTWIVKIRNLNRKPTVSISAPTDGSEYNVKDTITFTAVGDDEDGDKLSYKWYDNGKEFGNEAEVTASLDSGDHTIRVVVFDTEEGKAETTVTITVKGKVKQDTDNTDTGGAIPMLPIALILIVVVIVVVLVVVMKMRGGKKAAEAPQDQGLPPPPPPEYQQSSYDQGGYDPNAGYDPNQGYGGGGYDQGGGGYDQGGYDPNQGYTYDPNQPQY